MNHLCPAYLWIGPHAALVEKTISFLQQVLCPSQGNDHCFTCQQIVQQQHHATLWLTPEKNYTIEQLEPISKRIIFSLEEHEHYFFIIQHADYLSTTCSNSLLKSVEEPPRGYHFIFLAERLNAIVPTIRSRCIVQSFFSDDVDNQHPLFSFFTNAYSDPLKFEKELSGSKITEQESAELVNALLSYWMEKYKEIIQANPVDKTSYIRSESAKSCGRSDSSTASGRTDHITNHKKLSDNISHIDQKITILINGLKKLPMPGSSTIFWRTIFLQFMEATKDKPARRHGATSARSKQIV
jgi:DNA polymerase-3 subunit delta'